MAQARAKEQVVQEFRTQAIQEAALRVISRHGLAGATMQAIADEAGIAKGTIYLYFRNREALVEQTAEVAFAQLAEQLRPALDGPGKVEERVCAYVTTKLAFAHENREFFRVYLALCDAEPEVAMGKRRLHRRRQYTEHLGRVAALLREGMRSGEVRKQDPDRLALFLSEGLHAIMVRRLTEPSSPAPAAESAWIADLLLRGMLN